MGIKADPIRSREHILLSTLLERAWRQGRDLDLSALIGMVQQPPFATVGVLDLDSFYPQKDRFELAMVLNNLLAAPGFAAWREGEPLRVDRLLYTPQAKPRVSILSIAHLSDPERMFFVSLLLEEVLGWIRTQGGTTSLRALLYMDEIFGFMPPVAEPPTKKPLLTLLKQARAFGMGLVLATQNPVDLDYKGLSNIGTWWLGRLQTERDKARVLDGLQGAAAGSEGGFDRARMEALLAGLGKRVFLMHNVHDDHPVVFQTRWAMSYLRGPLTRDQISRLMGDRQPPPGATQHDADHDSAATAAAPAEPQPARSAVRAAAARPGAPGGIDEVFMPSDDAAAPVLYTPQILGTSTVRYFDRRCDVDTKEEIALLAELDPHGAVANWDAARPLEDRADAMQSAPAADCRFAELPAEAERRTVRTKWKKSLADYLYRTRTFRLWRHAALGEISRPGETEREFRIRIADAVREERDRQVDRLRDRYRARFQRLRDRVRRAEGALDREQRQARTARLESAVSLGSTLLAAVLGRKRAGSTASRVSRASKQTLDVARASDELDQCRAKLAALERKFEAESHEIAARCDSQRGALKTIEIKPRRTDITIGRIALAWVPQPSQAPSTR